MEYQQIRRIVDYALPTTSVLTVEYSKDGRPKRSKWRIFVLGNLDPRAWSTNEYFAPVLSMRKVRFLVSLAVHHNKTLHSDDVE